MYSFSFKLIVEGFKWPMARKKFELQATCYDKRGRLLSVGKNSYRKSHPLMKFFSEKAGDSEHKVAIHAELQAVLRAGDAQVYSIFVERYDAHGHPRLAKPCKTCQQMLKAFGVQEIRYTTANGIETQED